MKEGLTKQAYRGFFWQAIGSGFQSVIQIGVLVLLARLIAPDEFGVAQSALIVVGFANLLSQMGVGPAIVQRSELTENHIRAGSTLSLILGITLGLAVYFGASLISLFFKMPNLFPVLQLVSVIFVLESITIISQSLLQREMKLKALVIADLISYSVGYGLVAIVLGLYGYGVWALIWGVIAQAVVKNIVVLIMKPHSLIPFFGQREIKELLYFGGGFTIARFFNYLANQGDNIIAGRYLGADALGIYSRAYTIMVKPVSLIGTALDKVLFPAMASRQNQPDKLIEAFINGSKLIAFLCIPITFVIIFSSNEIIHVLLGEEWVEAIVPLQILTAGLIFRMGYKMGDILSKATGNVYSRAKRNVFYAICVLIGCYIGTHWGILGVSLGTLLAIMVNYILMIHLSLSILKINWLYFLKRTFIELPITLLLAVIFIAIIFLARLIITSDILILLAAYGVYGVICLILLYFFWEKLSFIKLLPIKGVFKKMLRNYK
ncbi:lipopolysaccharide biosynthesis protein [Bizionia myxarmorum]|uniref:Lipopolysaccharide biosynthesis protein n=1 Tax=Bizionia myxarmorum TaxID=291186 RepID=A0A5D0RBK9_9FLAO|nr:lipopolysaccharide biosynthesis protein [Bizionia myxarmorum]TYB79040.1 lipopolysaccharide biosynthesis protein [Bizionia myxarmorum]